jgi:T5orf172 domain
MQGYVYILVSPNSEYVKIGLTTSAPMFRIREINSSENYGASGPWELSDFREVLDCRAVEALLHSGFDARRAKINTGANELFEISPAEARRALERLSPTLLTKQEQVDKLFHDNDLKLYLLRLFAFTGLAGWLAAQGAWTFTLFPGTAGKRYFTINIGPHEVAYSNPKGRNAKFPTHTVVLDRLIYDFSETCQWVKGHNGAVADDQYDRAIGRATSVCFESTLADAEKFFALDGVRRAMIAYWTEALVRLQERGVLSSYARYHNYNAVAKIIGELRRRAGFSHDSLAASG